MEGESDDDDYDDGDDATGNVRVNIEDQDIDNDNATDDDDNDYDGEMLFQVDGDDDASYTMGMPDFDYRHDPYMQPVLTNEEHQLVEEDLTMFERKGVYPYKVYGLV